MPTTPSFGLRYPALTAAPNVPADLLNLATDIDNLIKGGAWSALTLNAGGVAGTFTATAGYPLQYRKVGNRCHVRGMVTWTTGLLTSIMTTAPTPPLTATWLGMSIGSSTTCVTQILIGTSGAIQIPGASYYTGAPSAGMSIAVNGSWLVD